MAASGATKFAFSAAGLTGTAALALATAPVSSPLLLFAGGATLNMFAGFLNDACKSAADEYEKWKQGPGAPARNFDLSHLAGRAIAAIVAKAQSDYSGPGRNALAEAAKISSDAFSSMIDTNRFREIGSDRLEQFLGAPHGGIQDRAARAAIWYELLVACLPSRFAELANLPNAASRELDLPAATDGLIFAAKRLWERFPAQFNGELRADPATGGRAWVAFQSQMMRRLLDLSQQHFASHEDFKTRSLQFARGIDAALASLAAQLDPKVDGSLGSDIRESRNLATSIYCAVEDVYRQLRDVREIVGGGPEIRPCNDPLPSEPGMLYSHQRIAFVGREAEMDELRAFLASPASVAWWLWTGAAGMGKSRLAYELCREFDHAASGGAGGWMAGFLDIRGNDPASWKNWRPKRPTLIVVDYALPKAHLLARWIADLVRAAERPAGTADALGPRYPVRLLLLERDADEQWLNVLAPRDQHGDAVRRARHTLDGAPPGVDNVAPHRALMPFTDDDLPVVVEAVYRRRNGLADATLHAAQRPSIADAAEAIRAGELEQRPLFVTLAAEAAYDNRDLTRLNMADLADDWLAQEREQWAKRVQLRTDSDEFHKLERLLALATICYGLPAPSGYAALHASSELNAIRTTLPPVKRFPAGWAPLDTFLSLAREASAERLPPMQPDYLGERFALRVLRELISVPTLRGAYFDAALRLNRGGALDFLGLAARDFAHDGLVHLGTERLCLSYAAAAPATLGSEEHVSLFSIAEAYRVRGAFAQAERVYRCLIEVTASPIDPGHAFSRNNLANMLSSFADGGKDRAGGDRLPEALYAEAETLYRAAMQADPRHADSRNNLANMLRSFADGGADRAGGDRLPEALYAEAETLYRAAMLADPRHAVGRYNLALMLQSFADGGADRAGGKRSPEALYAEAETLYRAAMLADPRHADSRNNLANMLRSFADGGADRAGGDRLPEALYAEAERLYRAAMQADPRHAVSRYNLALMLQSFADGGADRAGGDRSPEALYAEAERLYRAAMQADPRHADSRNNLANMLQSFADGGADRAGGKRSPEALYAEAERLYRAAMQADPRHADSRNNLANMLRSFADGGADRAGGDRLPEALYAEAETLYRAAMLADPRHAVGRYNLALMLQSFADGGADRAGGDRSPEALYAEAERLYRAAMQADPRHAESRFNLAVMLLGLITRGLRPVEAVTEAETLVSDSLKLAPPTPARLLVAAMLALGRGDQAVGQSLLDAAVQRLGDPPAALLGLLAATLGYLHRLVPGQEASAAALKAVRRFVLADVRLPALFLQRNAERAAADGHPEAAWLPRLCAVVEGRAGVETLDDWPAWREK